jgi:regulator of sigma E protease
LAPQRDFEGNTMPEISTPFGYILPFLFVLGVVVFVHELGHFLAARWCGVTVETFSIGFGPKIAGFYDRKGTFWQVAWLPLGGYVKFKGDENAASLPQAGDVENLPAAERAGNFHAAPLGHRAFIIAAGPLANFLLAIVVFSAFFMIAGKPIAEPRIASVQEGSAADRAGLKPGDRVLQIGGSPISSFDELQKVVMLSAGQELLLLIDRAGVSQAIRVTPEVREMDDPLAGKTKRAVLGVTRSNAPEHMRVEHYDPITAIGMGLSETAFWIKQPFVFIRDLINRNADVEQLGGPIRIAELSGKVAAFGFDQLIRLIAILSVSIGLLNLFPIPVLDGGHLVYYGIEAILGRPLSRAAQEAGFKVGLLLLGMLMLLVTWNDVSRYL